MFIVAIMLLSTNFLIPGADAAPLYGGDDEPSVSGSYSFMEHYKNLSLENITEEYEGIVYTEEWRDIEEFSQYLVSNFGRIKSLKRITANFSCKEDKILKLNLNRTGYPIAVFIPDAGRKITKSIHRIVATAFVPNPLNLPEVNHLKGITTDNRSHQLEWSTRSDNMLHAYKIGLQKSKIGKDHPSSKKVLQFDRSGIFIKEWDSLMDIQRELGYNNVNISACCRNAIVYANGKPYVTKTAFGFIWKHA